MTEKLVFKSWKNMSLSCHISVIFLKKSETVTKCWAPFFFFIFQTLYITLFRHCYILRLSKFGIRRVSDTAESG